MTACHNTVVSGCSPLSSASMYYIYHCIYLQCRHGAIRYCQGSRRHIGCSSCFFLNDYDDKIPDSTVVRLLLLYAVITLASDSYYSYDILATPKRCFHAFVEHPGQPNKGCTRSAGVIDYYYYAILLYTQDQVTRGTSISARTHIYIYI